ncbi:MAG: acyl-ACP--UDP-N-acetylglucosamine O-acyltransferase [Verrucomicrobiota bacterium]
MAEPTIHETAVVDPTAKVGEGTQVGPYCVVGADVELGPDCRLHNHVSLSGHAKFGARNEFFPHCAIGGKSQDLKYDGEPTYLEVGDDNVFREFVTVNRGTSADGKTAIGNANLFLAYSHVAHDCTISDHTIFSNNGTIAGHVDVGDHVVLGGLSAVHQFCRVGAHAMTGGCAKIVQDIPPFMIADGNPAKLRGVNIVGLQRRGFSDAEVRALKDAFRWLFRNTAGTMSERLKTLRKRNEEEGGNARVIELIDFIEASERGIVQ